MMATSSRQRCPGGGERAAACGALPLGYRGAGGRVARWVALGGVAMQIAGAVLLPCPRRASR